MKPFTAFGKNRSLGDGLSFYCLECNRATSNAHYRKRRAALGQKVKDLSWVPDGFRWCPSCEQAVPVEDYIRNLASPSGFGGRCKPCHNRLSKEAYWVRRYGLTKEDVDGLRAAQGDRCAICGDPGPQHLDHDHASGRIRRLLCQRCNHGLGLFRDDPYLLHVAALYVEGHRQQQAYETLVGAARAAEEGPGRPGEPPVGSQRRPGTSGTSSRSTGRTSTSRRQMQAGEADE
jgi:hypothetical protein